MYIGFTPVDKFARAVNKRLREISTLRQRRFDAFIKEKNKNLEAYTSAILLLEQEVWELIQAHKSYNGQVRVFLDDEREGDSGMIILRGYYSFTRFIERFVMPDFISFDEVLRNGDDEYMKSNKSGYDCAKFLVIHCIEKELLLPDFHVHFYQPHTWTNIEVLLTNFRNRSTF